MSKVKYIPLSKDTYAIVDSVNFDFLNRFKWRSYNGYAGTQVRTPGTNERIFVSMHRLIMLAYSSSLSIDHINGDPLDNRIANLRFCTSSQNGGNSGRTRPKKEKYKGVSKQGNYYSYNLMCQGVKYAGRRYTSDIEAAKAYDTKALELFGEFARTNKKMGLL